MGLFTNFVDSLDSVASSRTMGQFQRPLKGFGVRLLVGRESPCIRLVRSKPANSPTGSCHSHVNYSLRGLSVGGAGRAPTVDAPNCASRELGKPCKFNQGYVGHPPYLMPGATMRGLFPVNLVLPWVCRSAI